MYRQWSNLGSTWPSDKGVIDGTIEEIADQLGKQPVDLVEAILNTGIIVGGVKRLDGDKFELDTSRLPLIRHHPLGQPRLVNALDLAILE
jgi:hypothetical protein